MSSQAIILFLKAPEKGQVKTRLSKGCDEDFVLELYKAFVQDILRVLKPFENLFLFFWPPEKEKMLKQWLGKDYAFVAQQGENLGQKMVNAFENIFENGFDRAVLVGTDIPEIDNEIMTLAGQALERDGGVIGPSQDGGYYLIGLTRSVFSKILFKGINWSTSDVLDQTLDAFKKQSIQYKLLKTLDDIDTPQDLSALKNRAQLGQRMGQDTLRALASYTPDLSIIIPVINEGQMINLAIDRLHEQLFNGSMEIIVVDGHPDGTTIRDIKRKDVISLTALARRGNQMNSGASMALGRILVFLHCDTILPQNGLKDIVVLMDDPSIKAGAFDLAINQKGLQYRIIERTASFRSRMTRIPYGDQAIFIEKAYFFQIGQYPMIPIMEDVVLMQRIKKNKGRIGFINKKTLTSARRWEKEGLIFCTLRNWMLRILFLCGVSPERLARLYKTQKV